VIAGTGFRLVQLDEVWPRYATRAVRSRATMATLEWVIEQCHRGRAVCLECDEGMVIMTTGPMPHGTRAKVLLAVSSGKPGALQRRERDLVTVARDIGAAEVSFHTDRPRAWRRMLGPQWDTADERFWRPV